MTTSLTITVDPEARPLEADRPANGYQASVTVTWNEGPYAGMSETYWHVSDYWTTPMGTRITTPLSTVADMLLTQVAS